MQNQLSKGFFKKGLFRNFAEITSKHVPESFFDKVKLCRSTSAFKTRLQRRYFLVNFAKFVRTPFLQYTTRRLLLIIAVSIVLVMKGELASETVNYNTKHCVKSVQIRKFFWSVFSHIQTEYEAYLSVFSPNAGKNGPEKNTYQDTFHAVKIMQQFELI